MKWLPERYTYPLVVLCITISVLLQIVWLNQLFRAQRTHVKQELAWVASSAADLSNRISAMPGHGGNAAFKKFLLSPQWLQLKRTYNQLRLGQVESRFETNLSKDSSELTLSLRLNTLRPGRRLAAHGYDILTDTLKALQAAESVDRVRLDSCINQQLQLIDFKVKKIQAFYNYDSDRQTSHVPQKLIRGADFVSEKLAYNLRFLYTYQLIVPSINSLVIYNMRYYLLSSFLMILLTVSVFYFILRTMRDQRLYAEARQTFTGNMTHELKTPVATVSVALESITRYGLANDPEKLQKYIGISQIELNRLNMMIEKVLNLEQMNNGETKIRKELYDVQQGLQQVVQAMKLQTEDKKATITLLTAPEPCFVNGDHVLLLNVFYNLIDNALKYGGKGVHITVASEITENRILITFTDNGPGIAAIYHKRIFDRFFRVQAGGSVHIVNGTGLGLHYVKFVTELHHGQISLESEQGRGSVFTLNLPAHHEV